MIDRNAEHNRAYLLALQGHSISSIAEEFGVGTDTVAAWLERAAEEAARFQTENPEFVAALVEQARPRITPEMRREDAAALTAEPPEWGPVLNVGRVGDDADDWSFGVWFNDLASSTFSDWVEDNVKLIQRYPGVSAALREDRELILVRGELDRSVLEQRLREWWRERLTALQAEP